MCTITTFHHPILNVHTCILAALIFVKDRWNILCIYEVCSTPSKSHSPFTKLAGFLSTTESYDTKLSIMESACFSSGRERQYITSSSDSKNILKTQSMFVVTDIYLTIQHIFY